MKNIAIIVTIALLAIASNAQSQTMVNEGVDTVSVGSIMPYKVIPDAQVKSMTDQGFLDPSQFDWVVTPGAGTTGAITTPKLTLMYPDSILVEWGNTAGDAKVSVTESSVKNSKVVCTSTTTSELNVVIVGLPTLDATFDTAACGVNDYDVPLNLTGYGPWTVSYKVTYTDLGSNTTDNDYLNVVVGTFGDSDGTYDLPVNLTTFPSANAGQYKVTITNIDDRISSKAINASAVNGTVSPGTSIEIVAAPMPTTGEIKHIKN